VFGKAQGCEGLAFILF